MVCPRSPLERLVRYQRQRLLHELHIRDFSNKFSSVGVKVVASSSWDINTSSVRLHRVRVHSRVPPPVGRDVHRVVAAALTC
jgi:hypothetical protein